MIITMEQVSIFYEAPILLTFFFLVKQAILHAIGYIFKSI